MILFHYATANEGEIGQLKAAATDWLGGRLFEIECRPVGDGSFADASVRIEELLGKEACSWQGLNRVVFFDSSLVSNDSNPSGASPGADLCQLILIFPEIFWVPVGEPLGDLHQPNRPASAQRTSVVPSALFDGFGLRDFVKRRLQSSVPELARIPVRSALAVALDEERGYTEAHAYTLYRRGYRAFPLVTHDEAYYVLGTNEPPVQISGRTALSVSIEDRDLRFPDYRRTEHAAELDPRKLVADRLTLYPGLRQAARWMCTLDTSRPLDAAEQAVFDGRIIAKPHAGIYAVLKRLPAGFDPLPGRKPGAEEIRHAAPGVVAWIADALIRRAQRILNSGPDPVDCIRGAMLAHEAQEILGGKSATTSFEAIRLRHVFECRFETSFSGSSYRNPALTRFEDIETDITVLVEGRQRAEESVVSRPDGNPESATSYWEDSRIKHEWLVRLSSELEKIYRNSGDFEEAETYAWKVRQHNMELLRAKKLADVKGRDWRRAVLYFQLMPDRVMRLIMFSPAWILSVCLLLPVTCMIYAYACGWLAYAVPVAKSLFAGEIVLGGEKDWTVILGTITAFLGMLMSGVVSGVVRGSP